MNRIILLAATLFLSLSLAGQAGFDNWLRKKEGAAIEPFMMMQFWSSYSLGQEVFNPDSGQYEAVDNRFNFMLRRARLGFRAEPWDGFRFLFMGAYDLLGRDVLASHVGGANNGSLPEFGIWDAFIQWQPLKGRQGLNIVGGYFRPQLSRESITSGWATGSMEKSMSQNYIRTHLVGTGPGRAVGLNLGGLFLNAEENLGLNYNLGLFNPMAPAFGGNSTGRAFSPLLVGRAVLYIGDPEQTEYKIGYDINYFGQRKGLSLGLGGSWQGRTDLFAASYAAGADLLFNWGPLNLDGEWNFMWRDGSRALADGGERSFTYASGTGHARIGYNLVLGGKYFLEPTFMFMQFSGASDLAGQADAKSVGASSGSERTYDAGFNWHLSKRNLKILLHYTWHEGDGGQAGPGFTGNMYFSQNGLGAIRRGDWLGLGLHAIF